MKGIKLILAVSVLLMILASSIQAARYTRLTPAEQLGMVEMRQHEKFELDVYMSLSEIWDIPIFNRMVNNEQQHMDRILGLLNNYGIADPIAGLRPGQFQNPKLSQFYQSFVTQGEVSIVYALLVATQTEEISIGELMLRISQTNKTDIKGVYNDLRLASADHLRTLVTELNNNGITYSPRHLAPALYKIIIHGYGSRGQRGGIPSRM